MRNSLVELTTTVIGYNDSLDIMLEGFLGILSLASATRATSDASSPSYLDTLNSLDDQRQLGQTTDPRDVVP
jgi:hypothetical protein